MAVYTKLGKKIINDSITVDGDCYAGDKQIKIRALVEGKSTPQLLYITDLLADNGKQEIDDVVRASLKKGP